MFQIGRRKGKIRIALKRLRDLFVRDGYKPHQHYMRGPGPKTKARDGRTPDSAR